MSKVKFTEYLDSLHPISKGLKDLLEDNETLTTQHFNKAATLLMPKMPINEAHYIIRGACKMFWLNEDNEEEIFHFFVENEIIILPEQFFDDKANIAAYIVMLEDSKVYTITKAQADIIYLKYAEAIIMTNKVRSGIIEKRNRHLKLLMKREGLRYGLFYKQFPELRNRLADKDICSFLCISRSTLAIGKSEVLFKRRKR